MDSAAFLFSKIFSTILMIVLYGFGWDSLRQQLAGSGSSCPARTYTHCTLTLSCLQSLPGILAVKHVDGVPTVFPAESGDVSAAENLLRTVYDMRPVQVRAARHWFVVSGQLAPAPAQVLDRGMWPLENRIC